MLLDTTDTSGLPRSCDFDGLGDAIVRYAPDGVVVVDGRGRIQMVNATLLEMTGYSHEELLHQPLSLLLPHAVRGHHDALMRGFFAHPHRRTMGMPPMVGEAKALAHAYLGKHLQRFEIQHKAGRRVAVDVSLGPCTLHGTPYVVAFVRDISHIRKMEAELALQATHDALTSLPNRRRLHEELQRALSLAQRQGRSLALMLMDLNGFKEINDVYGHATGDLVLQSVSRRLQGALRASDLLARLGGDEFVVLLPEVAAPSEYETIAAKLHTALSRPLVVDGVSFSLSSAIGVSLSPQHSGDAPTLLRFADMAMYSAKRQGGNCVHTYDSSMGEQMHARVRMVERLRHALDDDLLELHYQPQIDTCTGQTCGVEALLRWNDPVLGQVPPDHAIAAAESTDLMQRLSLWIMDTACRQSAMWSRKGILVRMAINLSARQFRGSELVPQLLRCAQHHGTSLSLLEVEITESQAMEDLNHARAVLTDLHAIGVGIALDDFGEGYSNWLQLQRLPINRLKLSRNFLRHIEERESDRRLLSAMIAMAKSLRLNVVAEGVETEAQCNFLRECSCDVLQGWHFSQAMPAAEVAAQWLDATIGTNHLVATNTPQQRHASFEG